LVTVTLTDPADPLGDTAVIDVLLLTTKDFAPIAPKVTAVAPANVEPVICTDVPPRSGPTTGLIDVTFGT
jgi:hypothetical protein